MICTDRTVQEIDTKLDTFKSVWKFMKQLKGDTIMWEGKKYKIEDVKPNFKDDLTQYTVARLESPDGVSIKLFALKLLGKPEELQIVQ